jgi:hypothetical protein
VGHCSADDCTSVWSWTYHLYLSSDICGADIANKASVLIMQRVVLNLRMMVLTRANIQFSGNIE